MRHIPGLLAIVALLCACSQRFEEETATIEPVKQANPVKEEVEYYENGVVKMRGRTMAGQRIGKWESFYPNGYKWSEVNYNSGERHGPSISYYQNGIMRYQGRYDTGKRASIWQFYDTLGITIQQINMDTMAQTSPLPQ